MTEAELYTVYKGVYLPSSLHPPYSFKYYEDFVFRPDDILITTYPKSGEFTVTQQKCTSALYFILHLKKAFIHCNCQTLLNELDMLNKKIKE